MILLSDSGQTVRTIVWAVVVLFVVTLAAVVVVVVVAGNDAALVAAILGSLAPTAAVVVNLYATSQVRSRVDTVAQDTHDLRNGLLDAKVRAGVADVLHPELLDPEYIESPRSAEDRVRRDEEHPPPSGV